VAGHNIARDAIPELLRRLKSVGSEPANLVVKIAGAVETTEGNNNLKDAESVLTSYGLRIEKRSVGGHEDRQVLFSTTSGEVWCSVLKGGERRKPDSVSVPERQNAARAAPAKGKASESVRVLIACASNAIQLMILGVFEKDPMVTIVGRAASAGAADEILLRTAVDVLILNLPLPDQDSISYLRRVIAKEGHSVVVISETSSEGGFIAAEAIKAGAKDFIPMSSPIQLDELKADLKAAVVTASGVTLSALWKGRTEAHFETTDTLVAIGASAGGTVAISTILSMLPAEIPPILIVQHMPEFFSTLFAKRLNDVSEFDVRVAIDGDVLQSGQALLAPGSKQLRVGRVAGKLVTVVSDEGRVGGHAPSVDVMMKSVAEVCLSQAVGILLTGMGKDGAHGLLEMKRRGARTICQDRESSTVFGMPGSAIDLGAASFVLSLEDIPNKLVELLNSQTRKNRDRA